MDIHGLDYIDSHGCSFQTPQGVANSVNLHGWSELSSIFGDPQAKTMMTVIARSLNFTHMFQPFGEKIQTSNHGEYWRIVRQNHRKNCQS